MNKKIIVDIDAELIIKTRIIHSMLPTRAKRSWLCPDAQDQPHKATFA